MTEPRRRRQSGKQKTPAESSPTPAKRPKPPVRKGDTNDTVVTPGGPRPRSKVRVLAPGQHVSLKGGHARIIDTKTGNEVEDLGPYAAAEDDEEETEPPPGPNAGTAGRVPGTAEWIVNSQWHNDGTDPIVSFTTSWIVPPVPTSDDGQLVYLFNGLQPDSSSHILQPVLQWNGYSAGSGPYWSITNYYADASNHAMVPPAIPVSPGTVLRGVMTCTGQSSSGYDYTCQFDGYPDVDLTVTDDPEVLTWAFETLEAYDATGQSQPQCSEYPDTAMTAMFDIDIQTGTPGGSSSEATIAWTPENNVTDCGQQCTIVSNDSPGGAVYLYYTPVTPDFYFVNDKTTFGQDEISDIISSNGGVVPAAFYLALDGFTVQQLEIDQPALIQPQPGGPFTTVPGVSVQPSAAYSPLYDPTNQYVPQRILYPFDIVFSSPPPATYFPSGGEQIALTASITIGSAALNTEQQLTATTVIEFVAGADPYFGKLDPALGGLQVAQDLRVFTISPTSDKSTPIDNVPFTFQGGSPSSRDSAAAYSYINALIAHFNNTYGDPNGVDPFDPQNAKLPGQGTFAPGPLWATFVTGDSTVTPLSSSGNPSYNFALARVRLQGSPGQMGAATPVRVFFRLLTSQTFDTDFVNTAAAAISIGSPNVTYPSVPTSAPDDPTAPLAGTDTAGNVNGCSLPYFAAPDGTDLEPGGANYQTIEIPTSPAGRDSVWAYFGCYLNVYDDTYLIGGQDSQYWLMGASHSCLVAQIAYVGTPIVNSNGVIESPERCPQLAQRNLQITPSGQPGFPATHLVPQTFDTRPSPPPTSSQLGGYPDEVMIDWRNTPDGSTAQIYWPAVDASHVIALADKLYPSHSLTAADAHTLGCAVRPGMTYVPVPTGTSASFAGLITLQLPSGIHYGDEFTVVVRRVTSRRLHRERRSFNWRYVVGTFQMSIPVAHDEAILPGEENLLAILTWRLQRTTATDRWLPVLIRWIDIVSRRVRGLGGDPSRIPPSPLGYPGVPAHAPTHGVHRWKHVGKICGLCYDRFGDFDGFHLRTVDGAEHRYYARERRIEALAREAWSERHLIAVVASGHDPHWPAEIVLLRY